MTRKIFYSVILAVILISCSNDKATNSDDIDSNQIAFQPENVEKGSVPEGMFIRRVLSGQQKPETLSDMITLYKQDVSLSKGSDYDTNLKNMWMILIYEPLISEGTEQQKTFFIYEQLTLEHNLPHLGKFIDLLSSSESIDKNEKNRIFEEFFSTNKTAINTIIWKSPEEKTEKNQELVMLGRNYGLVNKTH